jgi:ArsR family transcriptional regulator, lead/cadmium/zinc/bismuth-responsive transcriptional repressor
MRKQIIKNRIFKCIGPSVTPQKIQDLQKDLRGNKTLDMSIGLYDVLAGEMRAQIIYLLGRENWLCVCDLADILATSVSAVSHQLAVLRKVGLVRKKKEKKVVYYTLAFNLPAAVKELLPAKKEAPTF